jgi:hypothetical protein
MELRASRLACAFIERNKGLYQNPALLIHSQSYKICIKTATVYRVELINATTEFHHKNWVQLPNQLNSVPVFIDPFLLSCAVETIIIDIRREDGTPKLVVSRIMSSQTSS